MPTKPNQADVLNADWLNSHKWFLRNKYAAFAAKARTSGASRCSRGPVFPSRKHAIQATNKSGKERTQ